MISFSAAVWMPVNMSIYRCRVFPCVATGDDISISIHLFVLSEASFVICNDPNLFNNASTSFSL